MFRNAEIRSEFLHYLPRYYGDRCRTVDRSFNRLINRLSMSLPLHVLERVRLVLHANLISLRIDRKEVPYADQDAEIPNNATTREFIIRHLKNAYIQDLELYGGDDFTLFDEWKLHFWRVDTKVVSVRLVSDLELGMFSLKTAQKAVEFLAGSLYAKEFEVFMSNYHTEHFLDNPMVKRKTERLDMRYAQAHHVGSPALLDHLRDFRALRQFSLDTEFDATTLINSYIIKFLTTPDECKYREGVILYKLETGELPELCNPDNAVLQNVAFPATLTDRFGLVGFRDYPTGFGFVFVCADTQEQLSVVFWCAAEDPYQPEAAYRVCLLTTQPMDAYSAEEATAGDAEGEEADETGGEDEGDNDISLD